MWSVMAPTDVMLSFAALSRVVHTKLWTPREADESQTYREMIVAREAIEWVMDSHAELAFGTTASGERVEVVVVVNAYASLLASRATCMRGSRLSTFSGTWAPVGSEGNGLCPQINPTLPQGKPR